MTKKVGRKFFLFSLPILVPFLLLVFMMIFVLSSGSAAISPPTTENKAAEYKRVCSALGVQWDIVLLADMWRAQKEEVEIENYNLLESALEFTILEEQKFTITHEATEDKEGNEQIIEYRTFAESNKYTGKEEILEYVGIEGDQLTLESLYSKAAEMATKKNTEDTSYEVVFRAIDDIELVLSSKFGFNEQEIQDIIELHDSQYLLLLYSDSDSFIGNVQLGEVTEVEQAVWDFLKQIGFSDVGCAAVMGNIKIESSFNPAANHNNTYFGLCQWGLGRWQGNSLSLSSFAAQAGTEWYDLGTQLNFFNIECGTAFNSVYVQMKSATDLVYATDYFCTYYEICVGTLGNWAYSVVDGKPYQCLADRRAYAEAYYQKYAL